MTRIEWTAVLRRMPLALILLTMAWVSTDASDKPLKVFILVGQSNMQGQAKETTLAGLAMDPETKPLYDKLVDENGKPRVHEKVYIAAFSQTGAWGAPVVDQEKHGQLTVGFGGATVSADLLGPELAFGATMYDLLNEPILLIKTSWGGKSLEVNFRPPSAEPNGNEKSGVYYRLMITHVNTVLADPGKYCPAYDPKQGYKIAGFAWFQGYNDIIGNKPSYDYYSDLLCKFIRDVRKDLKAPDMPFAIGVMGIGGNSNKQPSMTMFRKAMAAPAELPEFKGNVVAVHTADFWDEKLGELDARSMATGDKGQRYDREGKYAELRAKIAPLQKEYDEATGSRGEVKEKREALKAQMRDIIYTKEEQEYLSKNKSNAGYHYLGSAKTYSRIGEALAKALVNMGQHKE